MQEKNHNEQTFLNFLSRFAGRLANARHPRLFVKLFIYSFRKKYSISLDDFIIPEKGYKTFNEFFTRKLKQNKRTIDKGFISPVDGIIYDAGEIDKQRRIYVKHKYFNVDELIKTNSDSYSSFTVLYLSPSDYHRVHAPFEMDVKTIIYIPGTLKSVRESKVLKNEELYCHNERIILIGDSEYGKFSIVLVGALMVGKIKLSFENESQSNMKKACYTIKNYTDSQKIEKGEEIGYFEFGSSVIIMTEDKSLSQLSSQINQKLKFGNKLL
jgi:phosphatidylserine decarboxylase